jgi:hypothetical protein
VWSIFVQKGYSEARNLICIFWLNQRPHGIDASGGNFAMRTAFALAALASGLLCIPRRTEDLLVVADELQGMQI